MTGRGATLERRTKLRFQLDRELRFKVLEKDRIVEVGTGSTLNVSSSGVAFSTARVLPQGSFVELSISWPALLDGSCPMRLVTFGKIVRQERGMAVCSVEKYEFRTGGSRVAEPIRDTVPAKPDSALRRWADAVRKEQVRAAYQVAARSVMVAGGAA